jgi:flagellar hook-length control protein FliK
VSAAENPIHFAAIASERAVVAESNATVHSNTPLEGLSSASLLNKWSASQLTSSEPGPAVTSARIDTPLGAPGWAEGFQQKMVWLVDRQQQSAELHINPPHLGPVEIMLNIGEDGARITLCSPHASVRAAIEASLPELRAAFDERGLTLGEATVSADSGAAREQFARAQRGDRAPEGGTPAALVTESVNVQATRRGLVDIFA